MAGVAMIATGLFSPVAARQSPSTKLGGWSTAHRPIAERHLASARKAAAAAATDARMNRKPVLRARPKTTLRSPSAAGAPFKGSTATVSPRAASSAGVTPLIVAPPDVVATQAFAGIAQADGGNFLPPVPWVAANSSYVVQSVNSVVRVSNRLGTEITTIPVWSLFALAGDQNPTDARIIWDATHARWVAMASSFRSDDSLDFLNFAVSDSADPTAGWSIFAVAYDHAFPDYPSIASSNDKIVITDDVFDDTLTFLGAELNTFTWSSILGGAAATYNACFGPGFLHPRAAQVLSSSNDVHLIMEDGATGGQVYFRLAGTGDCNLGQVLDMADFSFFNAFTVPPDPRQTGDTITNAIDERPTDAIWKNGQLYWVSTYPWSYDGGSTFNDAVVIWHASTVAVGPASEVGTQLISAGDGIDDFMAGLGLTRDDNLVVVYSESSASTLISMRALRIPPGGSMDDSILIDTSDAAYSGERWGDFAGVAMDPVGTGAVWATHEVAAGDGTWRTIVTRLVVDGDVPSTPGAVTASLVSPTALGASPAVRLTWPAASDGASGTVRYQIAQKVDGGAFGFLGSVGGTSTVRPLTINHTYQFEVRAVDAVGTAGGWRLSPTYRNYLYQSTSATTYTGTWGSSSSSSYSGGSTRYSSTANATATFTASTAKAIAIVATRASSRGSFKVYVDNVYKGTISTYSTTTKFRQIVYQFAWSTAGTHKVKLVISGTSGHPRVDLDAFVVLR